MIVYQYDAQGYYVGEADDYGGPLPNNATRARPELVDGFWPHWTGTAWEQVEDHRGKRYWLPEDDWTSEGREMREPGPLPEGASLTKPAMPEDVRLARAAEAIRAERDRRLRASDPMALPDYPHADDAARLAWLGYRQVLREVPEQAGFPWGGVDDPTVPWPMEPE